MKIIMKVLLLFLGVKIGLATPGLYATELWEMNVSKSANKGVTLVVGGVEKEAIIAKDCMSRSLIERVKYGTESGIIYVKTRKELIDAFALFDMDCSNYKKEIEQGDSSDLRSDGLVYVIGDTENSSARNWDYMVSLLHDNGGVSILRFPAGKKVFSTADDAKQHFSSFLWYVMQVEEVELSTGKLKNIYLYNEESDTFTPQ